MSFYAEFNVRGTPKAQPRPRAFAMRLANGKSSARMYESGTAEAWKADVIRAGEAHRPPAPLEGPVYVTIHFFLPRPGRLMRKKDPDGPVPATCKPDRDNLDKAVLDALKTDGWFLDDAQVVGGAIYKFYHGKSGSPGAHIKLGVANWTLRREPLSASVQPGAAGEGPTNAWLRDKIQL